MISNFVPPIRAVISVCEASKNGSKLWCDLEKSFEQACIRQLNPYLLAYLAGTRVETRQII